MPYKTQKTDQCPVGKPYGVINENTGKVVPGGCHETKDKAEAHMRALYANVEDALSEDMKHFAEGIIGVMQADS